MRTDHNDSEEISRPGVLISTELVEEHLRTDFWREATRPIYEIIPIPGIGDQRLEGTLRSREISDLLIGPVTFNAQRYIRDRRIISWSGLDHYLVAVVTAGNIKADLPGAHIAGNPGDICVLDLTQTLRAEVAPGGTLSAFIPRDALAKATGHANLHGLLLSAHLPMTRLIADYLAGLNALEGQLSDDEAAAVQEALITTLAAALRGKLPRDLGDPPPLSIALRQRVLDFIGSNISNPELSPDLILQRFNVSRAHLYRAFVQDGGVSNAIRNRRLDAAFLQLTRNDVRPKPVSEIAHMLGFPDGNQLLRGFRARFGMTPSEARRERPSGQLPDNLQKHFIRFGTILPRY